MKVLCCLDGTNVEQLSAAVSKMLCTDALTIGLIYVIDKGPHEEIERQRERFLRPHHPPVPRREQMRQADETSAQDILEEGERYFPGAERIKREGRPEREIVQVANEWSANLIVISSRSSLTAAPPLGPKSVGHVARFVLDHAPCPVLLVRRTTEQP